jgi:phosphoribosyl-ATP pyrophosphohydrolase
MKTFEQLFAEIKEKSVIRPDNSETVKWLDSGVHTIGKKIVEEAAEVWMAAEYEGNERTAEEISQLIYHLQVLMTAKGIDIADLEKNL